MNIKTNMNKALQFSMVLFEFFILIFLIDCNMQSVPEWKCENLDKALLKLKLNSPPENDIITVKHQFEICNQCDFLDLFTFASDGASLTIDSYYSYKYQVESKLNGVICKEFQYNQYEECGIYLLDINECSISLTDKTQVLNSNLYLILALGVVLILILLSNLAFAYGSNAKKWLCNFLKCNKNKSKINDSNIAIEETENSKATKPETPQKVNDKPTKKPRMQSLDTFRGLSLFLMIFVNYGSGGKHFLAFLKIF